MPVDNKKITLVSGANKGIELEVSFNPQISQITLITMNVR